MHYYPCTIILITRQCHGYGCDVPVPRDGQCKEYAHTPLLYAPISHPHRFDPIAFFPATSTCSVTSRIVDAPLAYPASS